MGFYIRKSVSVGPLRFNLSKSGIGVSGGIKGFRVGSGPRGTYVHAGRGGLYYRQYLFTHPHSHAPMRPTPPEPSPETAPQAYGEAVAISSAPASEINDSSAATLLDEIRTKHRTVAYAPFVGIASMVVVIAAWSNSAVAGAILLLLAIGAIVAASMHDQQRRAVVVMYDLDGENEASFKALYDGLMRLRSCAALWSVMTQQSNSDYKHNAGATSLLTRKPAVVRDGTVPFLKTNVAIPSLVLHSDTLYFFPDRIFITNGSGIGAVSYRDFQTSSRVGRFIEDGPVPPDATQVDSTWKYVNKNGSRDRRFANNRVLPILAYAEILFASQTGVRAYLQVSDQHGADGFLHALDVMRSVQHAASVGEPSALPS